MKENIEQKFKELLDNQELPYNPTAWDSMKKALDSKMPVTKPTNWYRWFMGGAAITAIAVSVYLWNNSSNDPEIIADKGTEKKTNKFSTENKKETTENKSKNSEQKKLNNTNENNLIHSKSTNLNNANINSHQSLITENDISISTKENKENKNSVSNSGANSSHNPAEINPQKTNELNKLSEDLTSNSILIPSVNMCVSERQVLENKNNFAVNLIKQSNNHVVATIEAKSSLTFEAKEAGFYLLKSKNDNATAEMSSFEVKEGIAPLLIIESEIRYEKGVPTLSASTDAANNVQWYLNDVELNQNKNEVNITPFKSGSYSISIRTISNGCSITQSTKVQVEDDYNLLAVNAFNPNSIEPRNQSFIPYALTQREVKFTMLILDPKDGGVIYQTDDASQPWNGIDKRTGQLVPSNQAFIWKVRLANPLPGEPNEYKGTITKL